MGRKCKSTQLTFLTKGINSYSLQSLSKYGIDNELTYVSTTERSIVYERLSSTVVFP